MSIEILTRLNPRISQIDNIGISTAGGITSSDIAAACAGIDKTGELIILAKICGYRDVHEPLFYRMYREAIDLAIKGNWKVGERGEDRIRSVLQLAIYESVTQLVCPSCKGTKQNPANPTKSCIPCNGIGKWRMTDEQKAAVVGISKQAWSKTWQYRYDDMLLLLDVYEYKAKRKILRRLK